MPNKAPSTRTVAIIIVGLCVAIAIGAYSIGAMRMKAAEAEAKPTQKVQAAPASASVMSDVLSVKPDDVVLGNADAPVTIVEYSSLSCSHCASFHNDVLPDLTKNYIDTGKLRLVVRPFPLNAPALKGSMLVQCAPDESRAQFLKVLFEMQSQWAYTESYLESLKKIAAVGGMDSKTFDVCMNDKTNEDTLLATQKIASDTLKIESTPSFFINGQPHQDSHDTKAMSAAIDALITK